MRVYSRYNLPIHGPRSFIALIACVFHVGIAAVLSHCRDFSKSVIIARPEVPPCVYDFVNGPSLPAMYLILSVRVALSLDRLLTVCRFTTGVIQAVLYTWFGTT